VNEAIAPGPKFHEGLAGGWAERYRSGSFKRRLDFIRQELSALPLKGARWLDAGCGSGVFARELALAGASVIGVDASPRMLDEARARTFGHGMSVDFQAVNTVEQIPLPAEQFDGVICLSVIEYVDDPIAVVNELYRLLKKGGKVLVTVPNCWSLSRAYQRAVRSIGLPVALNLHDYLTVSRHSFTKQEVEQMMESAGFQQTRLRMFSTVMPKLLSPTGLGAIWSVTATKA
jgi:2-polyprenyl-3-methyl-5-hydroxy-6-metoxy-1,4-benzoquinol methylase